MGREDRAGRRFVVVLAALVALTRCGGGVDGEARASRAASVVVHGLSTTYTFPASADARVEEASPLGNFGLASTLVADLSPRQESHLRFSLGGLTGTVTRATLRLYASDGTSDGPRVFVASSGWSEGGITWSNRPAPSSGPLEDKGAIPSATWVEYDVTSAVRGNGELDLVLVPTSGDGTNFASREHSRTELRPQLVVTVDAAPPVTPECMPISDSYVRTAIPYGNGYVSQSEPARSFNSATVLKVDGSPRLESYLQFHVDTEGLNVRLARLWLHATDPSPDGPLLYRTRDDWSEDSLTWNTRPGLLGSPMGDLGAVDDDTWVSYDVTAVVRQAGFYSFGLIPQSGNGVDFSSSYTAQRPEVVVDLETPPFCSYRGTGGGHTSWGRQYGGRGREELHVLAPHPEGGFVAVGRFGEVVFPKPWEGMALARYAADGGFLWTRVVLSHGVRATHLTLTPLGNILVVGRYRGSPDFGTGPLPFAPTDAWGVMPGVFIAKFSPTGSSVWARGFMAHDDQGQPGELYPMALATDANGSLVVTGGFLGSVDLGGGVLTSSRSHTGSWWYGGGFVAKFSWEGQHLWSRAFHSAEGEWDPTVPSNRGSAVSTDAAGNVLVGGSASAWTDLGDGPLGEPGPFIAKYSPTGQLLWKRLFRGAYGEVMGVKPQGADRLAFSGNFGGFFTFAGRWYVGGNPAYVQETPNTNGFLGALTGSGADVWLRSVGTGYTLWFDKLAVGGDGSFTLSGEGEGVFDPGGGPMGFADVEYPPKRSFVARYAADGRHLWSRSFTLGMGPGLAMALQPDAAVVLGVTLFGDLALDGHTFTSRGDGDLLYLRLAP